MTPPSRKRSTDGTTKRGAPREATRLPAGSSQSPSPQSAEALLAMYRPDISRALLAMDAPSYRHAQVYEHLLRRPLQPFSQATALPSDTRDVLDALGASTLVTVDSQTAADGTMKLLLSGRDGQFLETVIMTYRDRVTVCMSSQAGCPVQCAFCATGAMGFKRNLSTAEIVDQVRAASALAAADGRRVSNLVYMGMGEPLLNLQAVLESIRIVTDPSGLGLAHRAISVSTVGIPHGILRLGHAEPQVNLALSLHAADDRTRALLIPETHRHSISDILSAAWEHFAITRRKLLVEYVLLRGINDSRDDARRLAGLLRGHVVTVNLLTWNPVFQQERIALSKSLPLVFEASSPAAVSAFRDALLSARVEAVVRRSKGADIQAACGQLAGLRHLVNETCDEKSREG